MIEQRITSRRPCAEKTSRSTAPRTRCWRSPRRAHAAPLRLPGSRSPYCSRSGSLSSSSSICREAPLVEHAHVRPEEDAVEESERRWAYVVAGIVAFMFAVIIFSGVHWAAQPPSNVETIDASRLHLAGEFMESNLGTEVRSDGSVIVRVIAEQYSFVPACIVVPADTQVVFRVTSPDVVHGFLISGTNVN